MKTSTRFWETAFYVMLAGAALAAGCNKGGSGNGAGVPDGTVSDCHFEFGTSVAYGTSLPCPISLGAATTNVAETRSLTGLTPATTYHYRLVAGTNAGTTAGDDVEFTTASPPVEPQPEDPAPTGPAAERPPSTPPPPVTPPPTVHPRLPHCKKGFHRRRVRGKVRCVRKQPHRQHA